ncbi:MAG: hypothetical protein LBT55_04485 [Clostridiaceae bacterium]|jgi:hypothetical protein|nr:hypothetical protein [Clostridiaceae bacterium]
MRFNEGCKTIAPQNCRAYKSARRGIPVSAEKRGAKFLRLLKKHGAESGGVEKINVKQLRGNGAAIK